jgi:hypothetical protein
VVEGVFDRGSVFDPVAWCRGVVLAPVLVGRAVE